jgi:hypothetical protein
VPFLHKNDITSATAATTTTTIIIIIIIIIELTHRNLQRRNEKTEQNILQQHSDVGFRDFLSPSRQVQV